MAIIRVNGCGPIWGASETIKPIINLPKDCIKVRYRIRNNDFVQVFVKTPSKISRYYVTLNEKNDWMLGPNLLQGVNATC